MSTTTVHAFAPPVAWTGGDGARYCGTSFAGPGYYRVFVSRALPGAGWYPMFRVELDPEDNPVVGFDEWRAEHTGFDYGDNPYPAWEKRYPDGHPSAGAGLSEHARFHETNRMPWPSGVCARCIW